MAGLSGLQYWISLLLRKNAKAHQRSNVKIDKYKQAEHTKIALHYHPRQTRADRFLSHKDRMIYLVRLSDPADEFPLKPQTKKK
jgi:hypothetical protein